MTVNTSDNKTTYHGDGVAVRFDFGFSLMDPDDLRVIRFNTVNGDSDELEAGSDFTISAVNNDFTAGGRVTLPEPLAEGYDLILLRQVPLTQPVSYETVETFSGGVQETSLDRLVMMIQQLSEAINRTLRTPAVENSGMELPPAVQRKNKYLAFDSAGNPQVALSPAGMALLSGSAIAYVGDYSSTWPATRPDGVTAFDNDDTGRIALDVAGNRMRLAVYKHGLVPGNVQASWIVLQAVYAGALVIGPENVTEIEFREADQTDPAGRMKLTADGDFLTIRRKTGAGTPGTWATVVSISRSAGTIAFANRLDMGSQRITSLAAATDAADAVRRDQAVLLTGNQDIAGVKNFETAPTVAEKTVATLDDAAAAALAVAVKGDDTLMTATAVSNSWDTPTTLDFTGLVGAKRAVIHALVTCTGSGGRNLLWHPAGDGGGVGSGYWDFHAYQANNIYCQTANKWQYVQFMTGEDGTIKATDANSSNWSIQILGYQVFQAAGA